MIFYITQREFGGFIIPIPIQNSYLRQYAQIKEISFSLPISEVCYPNNYSVLCNALKNKENAKCIFVLVSIFQLPFDTISEFDEFVRVYPHINDIKVQTALEGLDETLGVLWNRYKVINFLRLNVISNFTYKNKSL